MLHLTFKRGGYARIAVQHSKSISVGILELLMHTKRKKRGIINDRAKRVSLSLRVSTNKNKTYTTHSMYGPEEAKGHTRATDNPKKNPHEKR